MRGSEVVARRQIAAHDRGAWRQIDCRADTAVLIGQPGAARGVAEHLADFDRRHQHIGSL